jgi:hypothetical protein
MSDLRSKWQKVGVCRLARSKKVVLLLISEAESKRWFIVDVEKLLDLIAGYEADVPILEVNP